MTQLALNHHGLDPLTVAKIFAESGMFSDTKSVASCAAKLIVGRGLGLSDYDSMSSLHIVKGKPVLSSNAMAAAIKRSGKYDYVVREITDVAVSIGFIQCRSGAWTPCGPDVRFTIEDATKAGLLANGVWRSYPRAMLFARCLSEGYRRYCPDAMGCTAVYVEQHGEMEIPEFSPVPNVPVLPTAAQAAPLDTVAFDSESECTLGISGAVKLRGRAKVVGVNMKHLTNAMKKTGIVVPEDVSEWLVAWLPRIDAWLATKNRVLASLPATEAPDCAADTECI